MRSITDPNRTKKVVQSLKRAKEQNRPQITQITQIKEQKPQGIGLLSRAKNKRTLRRVQFQKLT